MPAVRPADVPVCDEARSGVKIRAQKLDNVAAEAVLMLSFAAETI